MLFRRAVFVLAGLIALAVAVATLLAHSSVVYDSLWFTLLWVALVVAGGVVMVRRRLWRKPATFVMHLSLIVVLLGALLTSLLAERGLLHLREGIPVDTYLLSNAPTPSSPGSLAPEGELPCLVRLDSFEILYYDRSPAPRDYVSHLTAEGRHIEVRMNHAARLHGYRLLQQGFDDDLHGSLLLVSHDPWGMATTYTGYTLFLVSFLAALFMGGEQRWCRGGMPSVLTGIGTDERRSRRLARAVRLLLTVLLLVYFVVLWRREGHIPLSNTYETLVFVSLCLAPLLPLASVVTFAVALLVGRDSQGLPLLPVLRSPWLAAHVGCVTLSYALLLVSFFRRPLLRYAVSLLAVGIFLGAVWAGEAWGSYWSWDPKEAWALVTLLVYAIPLHSRLLPWFLPTGHYRLYSLVAFACLLMTYFGVNYFLGGLHSYG